MIELFRDARRWTNRLAVWSLISATLALGTAALLAQSSIRQAGQKGKTAPPTSVRHTTPAPRNPARRPDPRIVSLSSSWEQAYNLKAGAAVEISVHLEKPSALPPNGRVAVEWTLAGDTGAARPTGANPEQIYTCPTANWRKVLHALDNDVYLIYRAPSAGRYTLHLKTVTDDKPIGDESARWREKGDAPQLAPLPAQTPWPLGTVAPIAVSVQPVAIGSATEQANQHTIVECEPNDTPEQAQPLDLTSGDDVRTWEITGGADDVEFFDNGRMGQSGDDWFRLEYKGKTPCLMTAQLGIPGQVLPARIRCYLIKSPPPVPPNGSRSQANEPLSMSEYTDGQNPNEHAHQQDESHRSNISRTLKPGDTYFLRVEANAPGYQLQLRTLMSAPYTDPKMAVRQGMYQHIGQVDAWLTNRPRGASVERRIRDSGNLLGTGCMSCHTQSGVWGPAAPLAHGYRLENALPYWHMVNVMYECLRPTNTLKDAANNTSLAPLDLGDGPAGTRVAGFNIVYAERLLKPAKLHSKQQIRTANFVLQTSDPGGINAAGPGSNVGQAIVYLFSAEILKTAWEKTDDPKYFRALEDRARRILDVNPVYTDDVAIRLDFFGRLFPLKKYLSEAERAGERERAMGQTSRTDPAAIDAFITKAGVQLVKDEARLRAIQNEDGSWGFNPGKSSDGEKTWKRGDTSADPAPTSECITGLTSLGFGKDDPTIAKGVKALLAMQEPSGRWNKAAQTGFVTTAYALHALSRLYPEIPVVLNRADYLPRKGETLSATLHRIQALALTGEPKFVDLLLTAAQHDSPLVRYWAMIGLGSVHTDAGVPALIAALSDRVKMVREAATWGLKQTLLDDRGWEATFNTYERGNDDTRAQVLQAFGMRADAVLPQSRVNWTRLTALFDKAMNRDPHPAVRAWAGKAAWQWWVWNPPVRSAINGSLLTMLTRPESNALVENCNRYSSQALFIVNGHKANGSKDHQYKELASLFESINKRLDAPGAEAEKMRLATRLVGIGGTFFQTSGGDGGPGQMGYATAGSAEMMGKATLLFMAQEEKGNNLPLLRAGIEGGANVPYQPLTSYLVNYSLKGPEELRQLAAGAVSDPRSVSLPAVPELVQPQLAQIKRGAQEPPRRAQLSDPILDLWSKVNWIIPKTAEQQKEFFDLIIPRFDHYQSDAEITGISDPAKRAEAQKDAAANWYLADGLGSVLRTNPDLHQEIVVLRYFPARFQNPLQERFWVQNVDWLLTFRRGASAAGKETARNGSRDKRLRLASDGGPAAATQNAAGARQSDVPDPIDSVKDRALQLYLDQLKPNADPKTRAIAIRMANQTALRTNPEVLRALEAALPFETDKDLRTIITNALNQSSKKFLPELMAALKAEKDPSVRFDSEGNPQLTSAQQEDIVYFRDYVMPELVRQKRTDQQACMGCHGLPGRVPSMSLHAPDKVGYSSVADLLANYRILQKRVVLTDIEKSKLLRKPLNVQDGKEDGHQGGRRYNPTDPGYLIIRHWVENQPSVQMPSGSQSESKKDNKSPEDNSVEARPDKKVPM